MTCALVKPASGYSTLSRLDSVSFRPSTSTVTLLASGLTNHLRRLLIRSQALVGRRTQPSGPGPLRELDIGYQLRLHPLSVTGIFWRNRRRERRGSPAQRRQALPEHSQCLLGEPGTDVPAVHKLAGVVDTDQQRAEVPRPAALTWLPAADHDLLPVLILDLAPRR